MIGIENNVLMLNNKISFLGDLFILFLLFLFYFFIFFFATTGAQAQQMAMTCERMGRRSKSLRLHHQNTESSSSTRHWRHRCIFFSSWWFIWTRQTTIYCFLYESPWFILHHRQVGSWQVFCPRCCTLHSKADTRSTVNIECLYLLTVSSSH